MKARALGLREQSTRQIRRCKSPRSDWLFIILMTLTLLTRTALVSGRGLGPSPSRCPPSRPRTHTSHSSLLPLRVQHHHRAPTLVQHLRPSTPPCARARAARSSPARASPLRTASPALVRPGRLPCAAGGGRALRGGGRAAGGAVVLEGHGGRVLHLLQQPVERPVRCDLRCPLHVHADVSRQRRSAGR